MSEWSECFFFHLSFASSKCTCGRRWQRNVLSLAHLSKRCSPSSIIPNEKNLKIQTVQTISNEFVYLFLIRFAGVVLKRVRNNLAGHNVRYEIYDFHFRLVRTRLTAHRQNTILYFLFLSDISRISFCADCHSPKTDKSPTTMRRTISNRSPTKAKRGN